MLTDSDAMKPADQIHSVRYMCVVKRREGETCLWFVETPGNKRRKLKHSSTTERWNRTGPQSEARGVTDPCLNSCQRAGSSFVFTFILKVNPSNNSEKLSINELLFPTQTHEKPQNQIMCWRVFCVFLCCSEHDCWRRPSVFQWLSAGEAARFQRKHYYQCWVLLLCRPVEVLECLWTPSEQWWLLFQRLQVIRSLWLVDVKCFLKCRQTAEKQTAQSWLQRTETLSCGHLCRLRTENTQQRYGFILITLCNLLIGWSARCWLSEPEKTK